MDDYLWFGDFLPFRNDVKQDALIVTLQSDSSDQKKQQHYIGESRREVHNLRSENTTASVQIMIRNIIES